MNIHYQHRTDRPDAEGRCAIHFQLYFDGQRSRMATGERCTVAEWNEKTNWFRKSFTDLDKATKRLQALRNRVEDAYSTLRTKYSTVTAELLKSAVAAGDNAPEITPELLQVFGEFRDGLLGRGYQLATVKSFEMV